MLSAEELLLRGRAAASAGRLSRARAALRTASSRTEDPDLLGRIEVSSAFVVAEAGDRDRAESMCRSVIGAAGVSARVRALGWAQLGLVQLRSGELTAADRSFGYAVEGLVEPEDLGRALLNAGNIALQRGRLARARASFTRARETLERAGLPYEAAKAGHNLGYVHLLEGDLTAALREMEQQREILGTGSPVNAAVCDQDLAEALTAAGQVQAADVALARAAHRFGQLRMRLFQGEAEMVRARSLMATDPRSADRVARSAARHLDAAGSPAHRVRAEALSATARLSAGGSPSAMAPVVARAEHCAADLRTRGFIADAVAVELQLIRHGIEFGELDRSADRLRRTKVPATAPIATRLLAHEVRGVLREARGHQADALRSVRAGLAELHAWQSRFGSLDLQSGVVGHGRSLAVTGLRMALADGRPELVFEWSERARALVNRVVPLRPSTDPETAAELAEFRVLHSRRPEPRSAEGRRMAALRERIRVHHWQGAGSREVGEPVTLAEMRAALSDHEALVGYLALDDRITAVVVTTEGVAVRRLGDLAAVDALLDAVHADLDMAATDLPPDLRHAVTDSTRRQLASLGRLLVAPLRELVDDRRLVITPSGVLARTPWSLLPGLVGRPVVVPRSATAWVRSQAGPRSSGNPLGVGLVAGPGVPRAAEEVRRSAAVWADAESLVADAATVAAVSDLAGRCEVLHLSAHGRHVPEQPLLSGLTLTGGTFYGYDIDAVRRLPEVVLLSACEVGRASIRSGEETVGMTAAWLHAGARSVIASPALVGDAAATDLLVAVHAGLAQGLGPAEALAVAHRQSGSLAPMVCFGAGW